MSDIWCELIEKSVRDVFKDMQDALWESQIREYPGSVQMSINEVFAWCDEASNTPTKLHRYMQITMALQCPVVVFYRIEGTKYRGFRFGVKGSEYMSLYSEEVK
jgi:hypothetical protein